MTKENLSNILLSYQKGTISLEDAVYSIQSMDKDGDWMSPIESERDWQLERIKEIYPHYPNAAPRWQYLNGLLTATLDYMKHVEKTREERIICAAIWYNDGIKREHLPRNIDSGIVISGWRHHNCYTVLYALYPNRDYIKNSDDKRKIDGFITSHGNFVDRKEAAKIAFASGQISKESELLTSEDLY